MRFLVTGGCGFIGSHLINYLINELNYEVMNIDNLSYASNNFFLDSASKSENYKFLKVDILDEENVSKVYNTYKPHKIMHLAAETHVDRSIDNPDQFIQTNIIGTYNLLKISLDYFNNLPNEKKEIFTFHHISTDEVFGDLANSSDLFQENSRYDPSSPYSASKASSDHLVNAWNKTYKLPILISNCSNNYGPNQYAEKLIPLIIFRAINNESLPVYGDGAQIRDWLYVEDHVKALVEISIHSKKNEYYNIGANNEISNIDVIKKICEVLDELFPSNLVKNYSELIEFVDDRPGHDRRYAIDNSKIKKYLKWEPAETFETGIRKTILWYLENREIFTNINDVQSMTKRRGLKNNA